MSKNYGSTPLTINFDASKSTDPENSTLTYTWNFGDSNTGNGKNSSHTFSTSGSLPTVFNVTLTVTDAQGGTNSITKPISLNNTPLKIISTSIDTLFSFDPINNQTIHLTATVLDSEQLASQLTYNWQVLLYHNQHKHPEFSGSQMTENVILGGVPCDNILYYYKFILTVSDAYGLSTIFEKDLFPNCNASDHISPTSPLLKVENFTPLGFRLLWSGITDNDAIKNIEIRMNNSTYTFVPGSSTFFDFLSSDTLSGKSFSIKILPRDFAGNFSESSIINFTVPTFDCNGPTNETFLSNIAPTSSVNGYGPIEIDQSNGGFNLNDGNPLKINNVVYSKGIGVHAYSEIIYNVNPNTYRFLQTTIGLDDEMGEGSCGTAVYKIYKDNILAYQSPLIATTSAAIPIELNVANTSQVKLTLESAGSNACGIHADWANAKLKKYCNQVDQTAPTTPSNLTAITNTTGVLLTWTSSIDNLDSQLNYEIFVDGILIDTSHNAYFQFINYSLGEHLITVQVIDNFGNKAVSEGLKFDKCPQNNLISIVNNFSNSNLTKMAKEQITAYNSISNNSNIIYQAGKNIDLLPGFKVENGSIFISKILGCEN